VHKNHESITNIDDKDQFIRGLAIAPHTRAAFVALRKKEIDMIMDNTVSLTFSDDSFPGFNLVLSYMFDTEEKVKKHLQKALDDFDKDSESAHIAKFVLLLNFDSICKLLSNRMMILGREKTNAEFDILLFKAETDKEIQLRLTEHMYVNNSP